MEQDKDSFSDLWPMMKHGDRVERHAGLDFQAKSNEVLVFDEVDELLFENPVVFARFIKNHSVIALTATVDDAQKDSIERSIIEHLGFQIWDHKLGKKLKELPNPEFEKIPLNNFAAIDEFVKSEIQK